MLSRVTIAGLVLAFLAPLCAGADVPNPGASSAPSPTPSSMPIPFRFGAPNPTNPEAAPGVLFVFATGGDGPTQQKLVSLLTQKMEESESKYAVQGTASLVWLVPQPAWQVSDYVTACVGSRQSARSNNDRVAGALIVGIDQISTYTHSAVIVRDNHTMIDATLFYSACDTAHSTPPPTPDTKSVREPSALHVTVIRKSTAPPGSTNKGAHHGTKWITTRAVVKDFTYVKPPRSPKSRRRRAHITSSGRLTCDTTTTMLEFGPLCKGSQF